MLTADDNIGFWDVYDPDDEAFLAARRRADAQTQRLPEHMRQLPAMSRSTLRRLTPRDPTAILDEPDADRRPPSIEEGAVKTAAWIPTSIELLAYAGHAFAFANALAKATEIFGIIIDVALLQVDDPIPTLATTTGPRRRLVDDVLERRRHGRAASCPVHGTTRGGTCWKCHRR